MSPTYPGRQSIYLSDEIAAELEAEAARTGMTRSALVQHAWRIARTTLATIPEPPGAPVRFPTLVEQVLSRRTTNG